jgi:iron complex outermembrane receptor protein
MTLDSLPLARWAAPGALAATLLLAVASAVAQEEVTPPEGAEAEAPVEAVEPAEGAAPAEAAAETPDVIPVQTGEAESVPEATQLDAIEVTGSRIRRLDYETAQPVAVVTREDIERTGLTNLGDILQRIPAAGSALNRNFNNGGNGQTEIDLRNLGSIRVLVLVNGHRWVSGTSLASSAVDLNTIPVSIIERIEVLKDGASAVYGSDAITGVVNVITRKDFSGFGFNAHAQAFTDGLGRSTQTNLSLGNIGDKTSIFVDFNFVRQDELRAGDRKQSRVPKYNTNLLLSGRNFTDEFVFTRGSAINPEGYFIFVPSPDVQNAMNAGSTGPGSAGEKCPVLVGPQGLAGDPTGELPTLPTEPLAGVNICLLSPIRGEVINAVGAGGTDTLASSADKFRYNGSIFGEPDPYQHNYAPANYLLTPFGQDSIFTQVNHSFNDWLNLNSQILYAVSRSDQELAEEPLRAGDIFGAPPFAQAYVSSTNIYNPLGQDIGRGDPGSGLVGFGAVVRRMVEAGPRIANRENTTIFLKNQFDGVFDFGSRMYSYDAGYSYGRTVRVVDVFGSFNMERVATALGPTTSADGTTGCPSIANPNCVPLNLFGPIGSITPEMLNYVMYKATETNTSTVQDAFANISTEFSGLSGLLPNDILSDPIGVAAGLEYRDDAFSEIPDPFTTLGISSGLNGGATRGSQNVSEAYLELALPIAADKPYIQVLDLSLAGRYTRYNTFDPKWTGKAGLRWKPIDDLLVRGTYSQSFRAPNLQELFLGATDSFPSLADPCAQVDPVTGEQVDRTPGTDVDQNCDAEGVPEQPSTSSQVYTVFEGNQNLNPEVANTFTTGFVWSPTAIRDFNVYVDYWNIQLKDFIGFVGPGLVLQVCYERPAGTARPDEFCEKVQRDESTGRIQRISASPVNFASLQTSGLDVAFDYVLPLADYFKDAATLGTFKFAMDSQFLLDYTQEVNVPGSEGPSANLRGQDFGDSPLPRFKANTTLSWLRDNYSAAWTMRFIEGTTEQCDDGLTPSLSSLGLCSNPDTDFTDGTDDSTNKYSDTFYHNLQFGYAVPAWNAEFTVGVLNVLDQDPPLSYSSFANTAPATLYETWGSRQGYLKLNISF